MLNEEPAFEKPPNPCSPVTIPVTAFPILTAIVVFEKPKLAPGAESSDYGVEKSRRGLTGTFPLS